MTARFTFFEDLVRRRPAAAALAWIGFLIAVAALAPVIAPYSPTELNLADSLQWPSANHLFGTDVLGRDSLSRLMFALRSAFLLDLVGLVTFLALGIPLGLAAGFFGGWVDRLISGAVDIMLSIPTLIILLVIIGSFPGSEVQPMMALGVLGSVSLIRLVRSATLTVRSELYIDAARVSGLGAARILARHVLPRVSGPILVAGTLFAGLGLLIQAFLGYLGFGPPPPLPSLGYMVYEAQQVMVLAPFHLLPPGLTITLSIIAFGLVGDAIRDVYTERWSGATQSRGPVAVRAVADELGRTPLDATALLSVRDLSVAFASANGDVPVLQRVSFDVRSGEVMGLVGESGCGKTVTALALMGLLPPTAHVTEGAVAFSGDKLLDLKPHELAKFRGRDVAMISQEPMLALDPVYSVGGLIGELVQIHTQLRGRGAQDRVLELLELVGLPDPQGVARRYRHELSGGMAQRVAIAAALAGGPKLLIADEPTTALDVTVQGDILELLRSLRDKTGLAIMFVTHDWGVVADLCQRVVVMYAGQVVEYGTVAEIFNRPLHPYSEGLLESNPDRVAPRAALTSIPGAVPQPRDWPAGCRFAPRCRYVRDACRSATIQLSEPLPGRLARCIRSRELLEAHA